MNFSKSLFTSVLISGLMLQISTAATVNKGAVDVDFTPNVDAAGFASVPDDATSVDTGDESGESVVGK
eukprot:Pgem_evm1s19036